MREASNRVIGQLRAALGAGFPIIGVGGILSGADAVAKIEAGADLVETNTFNATAVSQADYHLEHLVYELNKAGARVAREQCDAVQATTPGQPRFVIGVLGPTSRTASISPDVNDPGFRNTSFDELR